MNAILKRPDLKSLLLTRESWINFRSSKSKSQPRRRRPLKESDLDNKSKARCKNFYALGMTYFMFSRELAPTISWIEKKFKGKKSLIEANMASLKAGFHYAETIESVISTYKIPKAIIPKGKYRSINGNQGTAWGFVQAAEAAGVPLFLGSYPITPASDILHELSKFKHFGVKTFQAEDEIAGVCAAIGASFGGGLAITTSSGPGISLKGEAIGLAVVYELPLVVVNVQRGGPSTGLPTKNRTVGSFAGPLWEKWGIPPDRGGLLSAQ